jgi:hypothetical protein
MGYGKHDKTQVNRQKWNQLGPSSPAKAGGC